MGQDYSSQNTHIQNNTPQTHQETLNYYQSLYQSRLQELENYYSKQFKTIQLKLEQRQISPIQYKHLIQQYEQEYQRKRGECSQQLQNAQMTLKQKSFNETTPQYPSHPSHPSQTSQTSQTSHPSQTSQTSHPSQAPFGHPTEYPLQPKYTLDHLGNEERELIEWAYHTLSVPLTIGSIELKNAYNSLVRENHPDRGGNRYIFDNIQKAYSVIKNFREPVNSTAHKMQQPVVSQEYITDEYDGRENIYLDRKDFNQEKFNKLFDQVRIENPYDRGYGDQMAKSGKNRETINIKNTVHGNFNDQFRQNYTTDIIEYKDPSFMSNTFGNNCEELGADHVNDFSGHEGALAYTDYMQAHSEDQKFLNAEAIADKIAGVRSKTLEQLKNERSNISYNLDSKEKQRIQEEDIQNKRKESDRLKRMQELDQRYQDQYNRINQRLIQ